MNVDKQTFDLCTLILTSSTITNDIRERTCNLRDIVSGLMCDFDGHLISKNAYDEIMRHIKQNKKIQAIKVLRAETYLNLKDAKDVIEKI